MQNPEPTESAANWVPHRSIVAGSIAGPTAGTYIAALALPFVWSHYPASYHDTVTGAFTGLCIGIVGFLTSYFVSDNPSRSP